MARPTITNLSRSSTATDPYFVTTTSPNYDEGVRGNIRLYAVDAVSGSPRFTYQELMDAINATTNFSVTRAVSTSVLEPNRRFTVSFSESNANAIIMIRTGTLYHEIPGTTSCVWNGNCFMAPICAPALVDNIGTDLADVGTTFGRSNLGNDTTLWTGSHEITIGAVYWWMCPFMNQLSNYPQGSGTPNDNTEGDLRPVDGGFRAKTPTDRSGSAAKASLMIFAPAPGQTCTITNGRCVIAFARNAARRQDFDMGGSGLLNIDVWVRKESNGTGFAHNVHSNTNSSIIINGQQEDAVTGAFEAFSIQPALAAHPYIGKNVRATSPFASLGRVGDQDGGQVELALTGANQFQNATNRANMVLQGLPFTTLRYWQNQLSSSDIVDVAWLDPAITIKDTAITAAELTSISAEMGAVITVSTAAVAARAEVGEFIIIEGVTGETGFNTTYQISAISGTTITTGTDTSTFTGTVDFAAATGQIVNAPMRINETSAQDAKYYFIRSNSVDNQDSSGAARSSKGYVVGNQVSSTSLVPQSGSWMITTFPDIVSNTGTWTSRPFDQAGAGTEGVVGRGVHYLIDGAITSGANGQLVASYTRYGGDNESWSIGHHGIRRFGHDTNLRTTLWNFASNGSSGNVSTLQRDDIPGLSDAAITDFGKSYNCRTVGSVPSGSTTLRIDGVDASVPNDNGAFLVGATITGTNIPNNTTITAASATALNQTFDITLSQATTATIPNDQARTITPQTGYSWDVESDGDINLSIPASTTLTWTYSQFAAFYLNAVEDLASYKSANLGSSPNFSSTQNARFGGTATAIDTLLRRILPTTSANGSYVEVGSAAGRINVARVSFTFGSNASLVLIPDSFNNFLDFGSSFAVPSGITINGAYQDSGGAASFIGITLPSGVTASDLTTSVGYVLDTGVGSGEWRVGGNPTITSSGGVNFLRVLGDIGPGATNNTNSEWFLSITGSKTQDFRAAYTGSQNVNITLTANPLQPGTPAASAVGATIFQPRMIASANRNSNNETFTTPSNISGTFPKAYINATNILFLQFSGYNNSVDRDRLQLDILTAKNAFVYADFVMRYGSESTFVDILTAEGIDLNQTWYRIDGTSTSKISYLKIDNQLPAESNTDTLAYKRRIATTDSATQVFFDAPTYSAAEVESVVEVIVDNQTERLGDSITSAALGIPQRP